VALQGIYQQVSSRETSALRSGWKDLRVQEKYQDANGKPLETPALQLNDGMLRMLTILAQTLGGAPELEGRRGSYMNSWGYSRFRHELRHHRALAGECDGFVAVGMRGLAHAAGFIRPAPG
jgi:glycogen debranching enzyme